MSTTPKTSSLVTLETVDGIAKLTINRPEALNALNPAVVFQLHQAVQQAVADREVRGLMLTGAGRAFVAGADVKFFLRNIEAGDFGRIVQFTEASYDLFNAIDNAPKPIVACVHGLALGGGLELALTCDRIITGQDKRACLYYDIKLCLAPCIGAVNQAQYRQMIADLQEFLNGHSEPIMQRVHQEMDKASDEMRLEKAAALRDQLKAMQSIVERQKVVFAADYKDSDVIAMARADGEACVQIFFIRGGKLIGREYFVLEGTEEAADSEVISQFVTQF
jgi:hypothetical protein